MNFKSQSEQRFDRPVHPVEIIDISNPSDLMAHHNYTGPKFNVHEESIGYVSATDYALNFTGIIKNDKMHPSDAREQGFTIDTHTYPWTAYKGERFAPTETHDCLTDLESTLIKAASTPPGPGAPDARYEAEARQLIPADAEFAAVVDQLNRNDAAAARIAKAMKVRVAVPSFVQALHFFLMVEMKRVLYNVREFNWTEDCDPQIEGISWRPRWAGHWRDPKSLLPNFEFNGVPLWFETPGRATQSNVTRSQEDWIVWFDACHQHLIAWGDNHQRLPLGAAPPDADWDDDSWVDDERDD